MPDALPHSGDGDDSVEWGAPSLKDFKQLMPHAASISTGCRAAAAANLGSADPEMHLGQRYASDLPTMRNDNELVDVTV